MNDVDLCHAPISELARLLESRDVTPSSPSARERALRRCGPGSSRPADIVEPPTPRSNGYRLDSKRSLASRNEARAASMSKGRSRRVSGSHSLRPSVLKKSPP